MGEVWSGSLDSLQRARVLYDPLGGTLVNSDCGLQAAQVLADAVPIYRQLGSWAGQGECLNNLGDVQRKQGDLSAAARSSVGAQDARTRGVVKAWLDAVITWPLAELGAWRAFERHLGRACVGLAHAGMVDADLASVLSAAHRGRSGASRPPRLWTPRARRP
jgi:hypothetical protein